jgi:hypothetical protein
MTEEQPQPASSQATDFNLDRANLYQEESFTDLKVGSIKRFTPIKTDGTPDKTRKTIFVGQTSIYTPHGSLPIQNVIQAKELAQAFKRFPEAMEQAMQRLLEEAQKLKEQKTSPIIQTPESRIIIP